MSVREDARRAWRAEERASYVEWLSVHSNPEWVAVGDCYALSPEWSKRANAAEARRRKCLSPESKPWRIGGHTDPRRRYSRSHRRACKRCRWVRSGNGHRFFPTAEWLMWVRDPHGRK